MGVWELDFGVRNGDFGVRKGGFGVRKGGFGVLKGWQVLAGLTFAPHAAGMGLWGELWGLGV